MSLLTELCPYAYSNLCDGMAKDRPEGEELRKRREGETQTNNGGIF